MLMLITMMMESSDSITVPDFGSSNGGNLILYLARNQEDESNTYLCETVVSDYKTLPQTDG